MRRMMALVVALSLVLAAAGSASAAPITQPAFQRLWQRTGVPIQRKAASYSWVWGPAPFTAELSESYAEGGGGRRTVQYFDKSRMEINDPKANPNSQWFVTNGLLVNEMIQGQVQVGLNDFVPLDPANIPIAGDPDNTFPTYASLDELVNTPASGQLGAHATRSYTADGFGEYAQYASSSATEIVNLQRGRGIPRVFWDFMNQRGPVYENGRLVANQLVFDWLFTLGYPLAEPFWTRVRINGTEHDVLFQAFERRLLTYVPDNPAQYQVEMGNVGQHYYQWRYVQPFANGTRAVITMPEEGSVIASPLTVRGFENGQSFEAAITVRLKLAASGDTLAEQHITVQRPDIGLAGPFSTTLTFTSPVSNTGALLEVVTFSAKDGSEIPLASRKLWIGAQNAIPPVRAAKRSLGRELKIQPETIQTVSVEYRDWRDASLECPAPNKSYVTVITPGFLIVLAAKGQQYEMHTDTNFQVVHCVNGHPAAAP